MKLSTRQASVLLAFVISARATSFLFSKLCLTTMNTFSLLALRFSIASIILFLIFNKKIFTSFNRQNLFSGMLIGSIYYLVLVAEHTGLKTTNASTGAFLENLAIVIVPFLECLISKTLPEKRTLLSASLAIAGVGTLTMVGNNISFTVGDGFLLLAACLYAIAIITTDRLVKSGDPFVIGFFQVTTTGVLAWLQIARTGSLTLPHAPSQYIMILLLAIVCTSFGFTLQPVAQRSLSAETASSFCALGPLVASVCSYIFLKEQFTLYSFTGAVLILASLYHSSQRPEQSLPDTTQSVPLSYDRKNP